MIKTKGRLFLFEWDKAAATGRASELAADGWTVETEFEEGSRGCRNLKVFSPNVVVLDLLKRPSHSREVGSALRQVKSLRETPFIFVDGTEEEISKAKEQVRAATFTQSSKLADVLAKHAA